MNQLTSLLLVVPPVAAVAAGAVLLVLAVLHLARVRPLPRIPESETTPALAAGLLGAALLGLGGTYILTSGSRGHDSAYLLWLALAAASALIALVPRRA